jgi:hypothetical protein
MVGAGLFAAFRTEAPLVTPAAEGGSRAPESITPPSEEPEGNGLPPNHPPIGDNGTADEAPGQMGEGDVLPPNHPPVDRSGLGAPGAGLEEKDDMPPAVTWKVPPKWTLVPNASAMRLATYHVPPAASVADEAELTVVRAGGSTEANLQRWVGQFANAQPATRSERTVRGRKVSMLEVSGTFRAGGMMPGSGTPLSHPGWTLTGAVVETDQGPYFFKLTGPTASVKGARSDFDSLVNSITPVAAGVSL